MFEFWPQFLTIALIHFLAVASPGPDFAIVTRNSVVFSRRAGIFTALGIGIGISVHIAYSILGIGLVIAKSIILFNILKYIGAAYLIYIGIQSLRAKPATVEMEDASPTARPGKELGKWQSIRIGIFTEVFNPKATLFFLALFTQVIDPLTPKFIQLVYATEMIGVTVMWFVLVALFFSTKSIKYRLQKVTHHIERITGAILIGLGIKVALSSQQ